MKIFFSKSQINAQQKINADLAQRLAKLDAIMNVNESTGNAQLSTSTFYGLVLQNNPNPFQIQQQLIIL